MEESPPAPAPSFRPDSTPSALTTPTRYASNRATAVTSNTPSKARQNQWENENEHENDINSGNISGTGYNSSNQRRKREEAVVFFDDDVYSLSATKRRNLKNQERNTVKKGNQNLLEEVSRFEEKSRTKRSSNGSNNPQVDGGQDGQDGMHGGAPAAKKSPKYSGGNTSPKNAAVSGLRSTLDYMRRNTVFQNVGTGYSYSESSGDEYAEGYGELTEERYNDGNGDRYKERYTRSRGGRKRTEKLDDDDFCASGRSMDYDTDGMDMDAHQYGSRDDQNSSKTQSQIKREVGRAVREVASAVKISTSQSQQVREQTLKRSVDSNTVDNDRVAVSSTGLESRSTSYGQTNVSYGQSAQMQQNSWQQDSARDDRDDSFSQYQVGFHSEFIGGGVSSRTRGKRRSAYGSAYGDASADGGANIEKSAAEKARKVLLEQVYLSCSTRISIIVHISIANRVLNHY